MRHFPRLFQDSSEHIKPSHLPLPVQNIKLFFLFNLAQRLLSDNWIKRINTKLK